MRKPSLYSALLLVILLSFVPILGECDCTQEGVTGIPQAECEALLAFYESARGFNWRIYQGMGNPSPPVEGWTDTSPVDTWHGLTVENGHVTEISFSSEIYGMGGSITPELENLHYLQTLQLRNNDLREGIPPELGNLENLRELNLLNTNLGGTIPSELGNIASLEDLRLIGSKLYGSIPSEIGNLENLEYLSLSGNQLEGTIPPELGNLGNLTILSLSSNKLAGTIPPELGNLKNLECLYLAENQLEGAIPPELGNLKNLRDLFLENNKLAGIIPPELGNLSNLYLLDLSDNRLSGQIPSEIGRLSILSRLVLNGNMLFGPIPEEIMNLAYLAKRGTFNYWPSSVSYNALFTNDPEIIEFMEPIFGDWTGNQTVAPKNVEAEVLEYISPDGQILESNRVRLTWNSIAFQDFDGGYKACLKEEAEGPCTAWTEVAGGKGKSSVIVAGLKADTEYFLAVATMTYSCQVNRNTVTSLESDHISIRTGPAATTVFPLWKMVPGSFTGLAFSNYGTAEADLTLTAYSPTAAPVYTKLRVGVGKQEARLGAEFFGVSAGAERISWVEAVSDQLVGSFFTFGSSDLRMLDGAITQSRPSQNLYFTRPLSEGVLSEQGEPGKISIALVNPLESAALPIIRLVSEGEVVSETRRSILGKGILFFTPDELFTGDTFPPDCFLEVETTAGDGIIGFTRVDFPLTRTTLGLNAAEPSSAETLYSAQLASGPGVAGTGMETHIKLVNPMENQREVIFTAVAEDGTLLAEPVSRIIEGRTAAEFKAWELFNFEGDSAVGSLVIEANAGGIVGDVIFTPFEGIEYAAALPLQARPVTEAVFNHIANSDEIYTGLAFFNPGEEEAQITVIAKRGDGTEAGTRVLTLGAGERISRTLADPDMLPATTSLLNGFISIISTQPIICQQLYGGTDLQFLAAVPPTTGYGSMFE